MTRILSLALFLTPACKGAIDLDVDTPEEIADLCARFEPTVQTVRVEIPANTESCPWGEGDNLEAAQGQATARDEVYVSVELPEDVVVCNLDFQFRVDPNLEPEMVYDDHMFFLFNDVVLASSAGDLISSLPKERDLPLWDWLSVAGSGFNFDGVPWCLGQEDGRSDCTIPSPDTREPLLLKYDDDLVNELSLRAVELDKYEFGFVVFGDNDPQSQGQAGGDCTHDAFAFDVDVPFISN
ncbi:MAG: hypothetical protein AB8H79_15625 [Myxococcota bacterium]